MSIPSGDLAPVRKRRRGYGRRRRHPLLAVAGVLLVGLIAGGAYLLQREDTRAGEVTQAARCPTAAPSPKAATVPAAKSAVLPAPRSVQLRLLNGTGRNGLARTVGDELARRGFRLTAMGNAAKPLAGASRVTYGPGARPAATLVAAHVIGAQLLPVPGAPRGAVDLTLGSSFVRVRTGPEVSSYLRAPRAKAPAPATSPSCR